MRGAPGTLHTGTRRTHGRLWSLQQIRDRQDEKVQLGKGIKKHTLQSKLIQIHELLKKCPQAQSLLHTRTIHGPQCHYRARVGHSLKDLLSDTALLHFFRVSNLSCLFECLDELDNKGKASHLMPEEEALKGKEGPRGKRTSHVSERPAGSETQNRHGLEAQPL